MKSDGTSPPTKTAESIDDLVDRCEVARVLGIAIRTLYRWNRLGFGPPRIRYAGQIRYRLTEIAYGEQHHSQNGTPEIEIMTGALRHPPIHRRKYVERLGYKNQKHD